MPARVGDDGRRVVEPHRLVVQQRRVERRRVVRLEIRARVCQQREAAAVRVVHDDIIGEEVVVALDLEIIRFAFTDRLHSHDAIPVELGCSEPHQLWRIQVLPQPGDQFTPIPSLGSRR